MSTNILILLLNGGYSENGSSLGEIPSLEGPPEQLLKGEESPGNLQHLNNHAHFFRFLFLLWAKKRPTNDNS